MVAGADLIRYLLSAGGAILTFLAAAIWLVFTRRPQRAARAVLAVAVSLVVFGNLGVQLFVSRAIVGDLTPFRAADVPRSGRTALVILGSGVFDIEDWDGGSLSIADRASAARVLEAARVFALANPAIVISSGGNPRSGRPMTASGETMRTLLVGLGVPSNRIVVENLSKTTRDEAVLIAPMLASHAADRVIVVTSASHMRRSLGAFRAVGVDAIPAIALEIPPAAMLARDFVLPSELGLYFASANAHELLGIAYYWLRGWWKP